MNWPRPKLFVVRPETVVGRSVVEGTSGLDATGQCACRPFHFHVVSVVSNVALHVPIPTVIPILPNIDAMATLAGLADAARRPLW